MKTFNEAINIFKTNIGKCLEHYTNQGQELFKDQETIKQDAFFKKLSPWGTWGALSDGKTDYQRTNQFIDALLEAIEGERLSTTEQLILFAINFPEKGNLLSFCILKSISSIAGFKDIHFNYLIPIYQHANSWEEPTGDRFDYGQTMFPSEVASKRAIENLIGLTITGIYKRELLGYLNTNLGLKSTQHNDYGQRLLQHLDKKILEKAQNKSLKSINYLHKQIDRMRLYGESLLNIDQEKAQIAIELSKQLKEKTVDFFNTKPDIKSAKIFLVEFYELLHREDETMKTHREIWRPIITNIFIALTGIGALVLAGRVIYSSMQNNGFSFNSAFFFAKTNRQQQVIDIEEKIGVAVANLVECASLN